ncbi:MAG: HAD-IA family hydrolase [Planctomycetes bacterium]|nr:HAD-IA family hydrolase [Planctomycetota bacterium]
MNQQTGTRSDAKFRAVLFDLDGTLVDSLADIANSANAVLVAMGFAPHSVESYRAFVGEGVAVLFQRALPETAREEATLTACLTRMREEYGRRWNETTRPYHGIMEVVASFRSRGIRLAVLSNKPHRFSCQCVDTFFPPGTFDLVLGQRDDVPRKPDAAGAMEIRAAFGLDASDCLFVGDSAVDILTARNARMSSVGVTWGFRSREELQQSGADYIIDCPEELLAIVAGASSPC